MPKTKDPLATLTPEQKKAVREFLREVEERLDKLEQKLLRIVDRRADKKVEDA
jgi:hypothetical protein